MNRSLISFFVYMIIPSILFGVDGYKILITTPQAGSHMLGKLTIGKALVEKGHDVYLVVNDKYPKMDSIRKAGIKPITYYTPDGTYQADSDQGTKEVTEVVFSGGNPITLAKRFSSHLYKDCETLMEDNEALERIKGLDFDLVISEPFILCPCSILLPAYLDKPMVSLHLFYSLWDLRIPALPSFVNLMGAPVVLENLQKRSVFDKLLSLGSFLVATKMNLIFPGQSTDLLTKYVPQYSSWSDIVRKSVLFLREGDHRLGSSVPEFPNYISVAGMTTGPAKPLPEDLETIMTAAGDDGVVIVSFGSVAYYMPESTVGKFLEAFGRVNQTVLARFNIPPGMIVPKNVKSLKWMPQNDLLGHSKTRIFITHCGNSGQYEALYHGVPMLGLPWFAEQHDNCRRIVERGFGLCQSILDFTPDELVESINELISNRKYRETIGKASAAWKDEWRRETPLERAVFWIEHVIKYGGRHLRSPSLELSLFEFLMLDVIGIVVAVVLIMVVIVVYAIKWVCTRRKSKKAVNEEKKTN